MERERARDKGKRLKFRSLERRETFRKGILRKVKWKILVFSIRIICEYWEKLILK